MQKKKRKGRKLSSPGVLTFVGAEKWAQPRAQNDQYWTKLEYLEDFLNVPVIFFSILASKNTLKIKN